MTCSVCLATTPALQTINRDGYCPRCSTDYRPWRHTRTVPALLPDVRGLTPSQHAYNRRTAKLTPDGNAHRDKLVAARVNLYREER